MCSKSIIHHTSGIVNRKFTNECLKTSAVCCMITVLCITSPCKDVIKIQVGEMILLIHRLCVMIGGTEVEIMLDTVIQIDHLLREAYELKKKHFKPGFDGMTAQAAITWLEINGDQLVRRIKRGSYEPMPAVGFLSAKKSGHYRQLVKLSALDTVIQNALLDGLIPFCEAFFSNHSYAYRPNRGVTAAVRKFCEYGITFAYAAIMDPSACFDNINHDVLEKALSERLDDPALVTLIMKYVRMPVILQNETAIPTKGILQGAPCSNLLCNIYLSALDQHLEERDIPFIRYADDIVIFSSDRDELARNYEDLLHFMKESLFFEGSRKKCKIAPAEELTFLGYRFQNSRYGLSAIETEHASGDTYRQWHEAPPVNNHRCVDIVSSGILRQRDFSAVFETEDTTVSIPTGVTDTVNIYSSVILDSNFLQHAMKNNITVNVFDQPDHLIGRFLPNRPMHSPHVPHRQLLAYYDEAVRLALAKKFVLASVHNCRLNIRYYNKQTPSSLYEGALTDIKSAEMAVKVCKDYNTLLMLEARIRESYYSCFEGFLSDSSFRFDSRSRRPPKSEINAMLSFGNVLLYNLIATEINKTPLDIRIGFLHATNRRPESLNLDVAEAYKPLIVDRTVFSMINLKSIRLTDFDHRPDGSVYLNENGKRAFLRAFYSKLDTSISVKGNRLTYRQIIAQDVQALVRHFRQEEPYTPFKQVK